MMLYHDTLHSPDFTSQLSRIDLADLLKSARHSSFRRKEAMFTAGERSDNALLISRGCAKLYRVTEDGREVIFRFSMAGEIIGLSEMLSDTPREISAEAQMATEAHLIPRGAILHFFRDRPEVAIRAIAVLSSRVRALEESIVNLATEHVELRLLRLLERVATGTPSDSDGVVRLDFPFTHQDIANQISASRQTVSAIFSELRKRGVIATEGRTVLLLRRDRLERELEDASSDRE